MNDSTMQRLSENEMQAICQQDAGLAKAADDYSFQVPYDGSNKFYNDHLCNGFVAGAEWQRKRTDQAQKRDEEIEALFLANADCYTEPWEKPAMTLPVFVKLYKAAIQSKGGDDEFGEIHEIMDWSK